MKNEIKEKIKKSENIVSKEAIEHLKKKKIVAISNNFIQLERKLCKN